jgi:type I restriction-modification system DNA methylase subunit
LGSTTLLHLRKSKYIRTPLTKAEETRKPDGIVILPRGGVKAVVEVKTPQELTAKKLPAIIEKYSPIAAACCNLLIITDGRKSFWINPHTKENAQINGKDVREIFNPVVVSEGELSNEQTATLVDLIDRCDQHLNGLNNALEAAAILDPSPLARSVWQKIWISTGKEPEKCLYNVVEIFVFKFLSDLGVLTGTYSFKSVVDKISEGPEVPLDFYGRTIRPRIRALFPAGEDRTTIINGTIFVNEQGDPNPSQASLFNEVIEAFQQFDDEHGSMRNIEREFKTRLYESFLRQSAGVKSLGQYFTPRNVVQAMVRMSQAERLGPGARICDPFCGVGGFILETIAEVESIRSVFEPVNGKVRPSIQLRGYDKGSDEKEDERTIILAKANMLIYLSELLTKYNTDAYLKEFSEHAFNDVFKLLRTNLGTFKLVKEEPYDLILTNPPYVTSGVTSIRNAIEAEGLTDAYPAVGKGTESLAITWIVSHLKPGGRALVVVPDGLLVSRPMLDYIQAECVVEAITSLPSRTFFSTVKKTYIIELTKKRTSGEEQKTPVLVSLISEIGESRDARRLSLEQNDLTEMVEAHGFFQANKARFKPTSPRIKVLSWAQFSELRNWQVDRLWTREEREALGIEEERSEIDEAGFRELVGTTIRELQGFLEVTDD